MNSTKNLRKKKNELNQKFEKEKIDFCQKVETSSAKISLELAEKSKLCQKIELDKIDLQKKKLQNWINRFHKTKKIKNRKCLK